MNAYKDPYPRTVDEAVDRLHANISLNDEILLASTNEENLIDLHFGLVIISEMNSVCGLEMMIYLNLAASYQETEIFMWMMLQR